MQNLRHLVSHDTTPHYAPLNSNTQHCTSPLMAISLVTTPAGKKPGPTPVPSGASSGLAGPGRSGTAHSRHLGINGDVVRSDLDQQRIMNNFEALAKLEVMCKAPDMELDPWQRRWQTIHNYNHVIQDPMGEVGRLGVGVGWMVVGDGWHGERAWGDASGPGSVNHPPSQAHSSAAQSTLTPPLSCCDPPHSPQPEPEPLCCAVLCCVPAADHGARGETVV